MNMLVPIGIASTDDAAAMLLSGFAGLHHERLAILHLDKGNALIASHATESKSKDCTVAMPLRAIIADAIRLGTAGLVIAHNHPSGDPRPSRADLDATRALADLARPLGVRLYDHLIFGGAGRWRSLRAMGLL